MNAGTHRLSTVRLNQLFLDGLGAAVEYVQSVKEKPLVADIRLGSYTAKLRAYLYNCTNPPGGRASDEYKCQIIVPGQERGQRGHFNFDGRIVILGAYALLSEEQDIGVFVFWDAMCHENFSYSANIQVKTDVLIGALSSPVSYGRRNNNETIIACRPEHLLKGIEERIHIVSL